MKVAIVGCGHVATHEHIPGIRRAGGEVVALVDSQPGRASAAAAASGVPAAFESSAEMLARTKADVVAVCAPPEAHHAVALEAIAAGRHVYLEKPPTASADQIAEVARAATQAGVCLLAGSHHPYRANVRLLREKIRAGELGTVYAVDCFKLRRAAAPADRPDLTQPQGVAFFSSVHRLDVVLYLLGNPGVLSVSARTYGHFVNAETVRRTGRPASGAIEDTLIALIQFDNGCTLTLRDMHAAHMEEPNHMQCWFGDLTVFGTRGGARLHPLTLFETLPDGGQRVAEPAVSNDLHDSHYPAYRCLFECIREGRQPEGSPERAVLTMRLIEAIYSAAAAVR